MKILNISQSFSVKGGSDVYFYALKDLLERQGHTVENFAATENSRDKLFPLEVDFEKRSLSTFLKYIYNYDARSKMNNFLRNKNYDLAHLHIYYGKLSASILGALKNRDVPMVQTLHEYKLVCPTYKLYDGYALCNSCRNRMFYHCALKRCNRGSFARSLLSTIESYVSLWNGAQSKIDHFISVSDFQRNQMISMGLHASKVTTVHNFLDIGAYRMSEVYGDYILYFGRLEKVKGLEVLLDSLQHVRSDIRLVIVGDGELKDKMLSKIAVLNNKARRVFYKGFLQGRELAEVIRNCRFVVVPSIWYETFGLTVIESMAYGKPVIGSNIGGITEIISHGEDGYLVEPNNVAELAKQINSLFGNKDIMEMGRKARKNVEDNFSADVHYEKLSKVYRKILGK